MRVLQSDQSRAPFRKLSFQSISVITQNEEIGKTGRLIVEQMIAYTLYDRVMYFNNFVSKKRRNSDVLTHFDCKITFG